MNRTWTAALLLALAAVPAGAVSVELLSRVPPRRASETASGESRPLAISSDGRYTVLASEATNLVSGMAASPPRFYLFLYDRETGTTTRISRSPLHPSDADSQAAISADGRFVAFTSWATDEVEGQLNANEEGPDVFFWDRETGETKLVSHSDANPLRTGDRSSSEPVMDASGRFVAFTSQASDLLGPSGGLVFDSSVFLWDRETGEAVPVSHPAGQPGQRAGDNSWQPSISADGRFVAFVSWAPNLVAGQVERGLTSPSPDAFLWDRTTRQTVLVSRAAGNPLVTANRPTGKALVSADGRFVALLSGATDLLPGRRGGGGNVFLWERATGAMTLVSHGSQGDSPARRGFMDLTAIAANGSHVLFSTNARNLVPSQGEEPRINVFLWSRASGRNTLISRGGQGRGGNGDSFATGLSADGAWLVFDSNASDLVPGDDNGGWDVFLANGRSGRVTLLSTSEETGKAADSSSFTPLISADGRWISFMSYASRLVSGVRDSNLVPDVVLADRSGNKTIVTLHPEGLASATPQGGSAALSIDASGRFVVFTSDADASLLVPGVREANFFGVDVFLHDRELRTTTLLSHSATDPKSTANGTSFPEARISTDGRWVAFTSEATDLVPGFTASPDKGDVFLWDRTTGRTVLVSRTAGSSTAGGGLASDPRISADGSVVVFQSFAGNLVPGQTEIGTTPDVFLFDRTTETVSLVSRAAGSETVTANGHSILPKLSADGRIVAYTSSAGNLVAGASDQSSTYDVFLFDRTSGVTTLASRTAAPALTAGNGIGLALSGNGRFAVFESPASDLVPGQTDRPFTPDLFLFDRISGTTTLVTHEAGSPTAAAAAGTSQADLSADGRFVAFASMAENLVPGQVDEAARRGSIDIFVFDRETGATEMITRAAGTVATAGRGGSATPVISADGRRVAFVSNRLDLSPGLHGPRTGLNLFVHDRPAGTTTLVSHSLGEPARMSFGNSSNPLLDANGSVAAFTSTAPDLVSRDFNRNVGPYSDAFAAAIP